MAVPKYISNANKIIDLLVEQPGKRWVKTQRELGAQLGFSQPELSNLLSVLAEAGRIRKGDPLPGVRGRNYTIEMLDSSHLDGPIHRSKPTAVQNDRVLTPEEMISQPVNLQSLTLDQVGAAVVHSLREAWEDKERFAAYRSESLTRTRELREQLAEERTYRTRYADEKAALARKIEEQEAEITQMRAEINQLLVKANQRKQNAGSGFQVRDILDDDELKMLANLMQARPGTYRQAG